MAALELIQIAHIRDNLWRPACMDCPQESLFDFRNIVAIVIPGTCLGNHLCSNHVIGDPDGENLRTRYQVFKNLSAHNTGRLTQSQQSRALNQGKAENRLPFELQESHSEVLFRT